LIWMAPSQPALDPGIEKKEPSTSLTLRPASARYPAGARYRTGHLA
jgi:hypothetical protein